MRTWNPARVALLTELRRQGLSNGKIAARLTDKFRAAFTIGMVAGEISRLELPPRMPAPPPWSAADVSTLREMSKAGQPDSAIAAAVNRTVEGVRKQRQKLKVACGASERKTPPRTQPSQRLVDGRPATAATKLGRIGASASLIAVALPPAEAAPRDPWRWDAQPRPESRPAILIDLNFDQCRWPLEEQKGIRGRFLFCGAENGEGCPYCEFHAGRAGLNKWTPRERGKAEAA